MYYKFTLFWALALTTTLFAPSFSVKATTLGEHLINLEDATRETMANLDVLMELPQYPHTPHSCDSSSDEIEGDEEPKEHVSLRLRCELEPAGIGCRLNLEHKAIMCHRYDMNLVPQQLRGMAKRYLSLTWNKAYDTVLCDEETYQTLECSVKHFLIGRLAAAYDNENNLRTYLNRLETYYRKLPDALIFRTTTSQQEKVILTLARYAALVAAYELTCITFLIGIEAALASAQQHFDLNFIPLAGLLQNIKAPTEFDRTLFQAYGSEVDTTLRLLRRP